MLSAQISRIKRIGKRMFRVALCAMLVLQMLWVPNSALASSSASAFYFRGYNTENINTTTLSYATSDASVSGGSVTFDPLSGEGETIGLINLDETGHDISKSVDLGGLEIDFSTVSNITEEGTAGADNDVPTAKILFCSSANIGSVISSVTLTKADNAIAGSETLSSGANIPSGTRSIFISLNGKNKTGNNTVSFSGTSLAIKDAGAPSCSAEYNKDWTNQNVTVTITAADSDAGLEGIYVNGGFVSATSPYIFTITDNNTSFTAYATDLAGKQSDVVSGTVDHIDKTTPAAPSSVPLSSSAWSNTDVFVLMPALPAATGAPERYVYQIGANAWADLTDGFAITAEGNTTIRVAVADEAGNRSSAAQATAMIDKSNPTISNATITSGSSSAKVDVTATDVGLSGIQNFLYAAGEQTAEYFTTGGTAISGGSFTVDVGGTYTLFASDYAGNTALKTISITTAPTFETVDNVTMSEDEMRNVPLTISDAESSRSELTIQVSTSDDTLLKTVVLHQSEDAISLDITPAANQSGGPVSVTVSVEDPSGQKVTRTFTVTVAPVNDSPIARDDDGITLSEDGVVEIDVLGNDDDLADGDTISISDVGEAAHGTTLIVLDKIRYTPDEDYAGADSFTYTITDGNGGTAEATVRIVVEQKNDAPTAVDDTALTAEDAPVTIDVLLNDTDVDMDTNAEETIALDSCENGTHGTAQIVGGMIEYTPEANFNGTDTFTYTIVDKAGLSAEATVTVVVSPEADAPWFFDLQDEYTIDEDAKDHEIAFEIHDVETPQDSLMLQAATLKSDLIDQSGIALSGLGGSSAAVKLLLTPQANMFGDVQIKLTLGDGFEAIEKTITIHILNVNDAPRAVGETLSFTEDAPYFDISIADLLSNDSDIDSETIDFDGIGSDPSSGAISLFDADTLRYIPAKDFDGTTSFTYYISDGTARTLATCTLEAIGVNDAPGIVVEPDEIPGTEDTPIVIPFLVSDNESAATDLSVIAASSDDSIVTTDDIEIVINSDGTGEVRIQPAADANGTVLVTLTVSDGAAQAGESVTLVIAPVQDAPVAEDDLIYVHYTTSRSFSVLTNDHDVDGNPIRVKEYAATLPGTLTFDSDTQMFNYVPAIGETGTVSFTYTLSDGTDTDTASVTLDVQSETHEPVITAIDSRYINEDGTVNNIAFGVSDEDIGDTATISVKSGDLTLLPEDAEHIVVTDLGGGNYSLSLKPGADQTGTTSVSVTVTDKAGLSDTTTFYLHVIPQNDAPVAVNDALSVDEDGALLLSILANDYDPDLDTIWLSSISNPVHGYIERTGNTYTYYPHDNWSGSETLTYRISDGRASAQATATITVNPVNDAPVAWDNWQTVPNTTGSESANINVLGNDYDVDGDVIRVYQIETAPKYGTVEIKENGTITYTRNQISPLGNGADSFVYSIIDRNTATGDFRTASATVHIGVFFTSTLNTYGETVTCYEDDAAFNFDLSVNNPTPVNYALTVNTTTTLGTFEVVDNNTVRFTPAPDQYGYAVITYTVEQIGGGEKDTGTIWLRVYPVNDLPAITSAPTSATMDEDASGGTTFDIAYHDADCGNEYLYFYVYTKNGSTTAPIPFQVSYSSVRTDEGRRVTIKTAENVNGTGTIVVGISDGMTYVEKEIALTVNPVDDAPIVAPVSKTINEDSSVAFASPGSDSEVDGDTVVESIDPLQGPQHGTATIRANHTIYYVPDANYYGTDTFYVIVTDQTDAKLSSTALVNIAVKPINDPPEISNLDYYQTMDEDDTLDVTLTVSDVDNILTHSTDYTLTSDDQNLVKNENITISHVAGEDMVIHVVPEANAYGTVKINIVASDGKLTAKGAFLLKIVPVNDPPLASDDAFSVDEVTSTGAEAQPPKTVKTIDLLVNDSDVEDGKPKIVTISNVLNGTVTNIGSGKVLVSAEGDSTQAVTFTYTVMDRAGATASANVTLTINPVNDPPRAKNDYFTIFEDASPLFDVLYNDMDPESDPLTIAAVGTPAHGSASIDDNKISYEPNQNYFGTDSFTYTVSDGNGGTATATIYITIKPVNDAPTINKHSSSDGDWVMQEDTPASFNFVVADPESATANLIIKITSLDETLVKTTQIALTTNAAGYKTLTITPAANAHGELTIRIWASDGLLNGQAIYTVEIISVNDAPVVTVPVQTTKEDTALHATAYATDADGDSVTFSKKTDPAHGTVTVHADGTFDYMPAKDYNGEDSFIIQADDGQPDNNIGYATVHITVKPDGDPPTAQDDSITIDEDIQTLIPVLENDSDEDVIYGDTITLLRVTTPAHGTATISEGGILYTPNANYNGSDTFGYTITDRDGKTATATVSITIQPINDKPSGGDDTASVQEDHSVTIDVTLNDDIDETTNPDIEDVTIVTVDTPAHGTAVVSTDKKSITYTPNADWFSPVGAPEVFYYTAKDSSNQTERFAVAVTVISVNDLPVISPDLQNVTTPEDTRTDSISFTVSDIETAAGSLKVTATHLNGVLLPPIAVTPDANGLCTFTVLPKADKVGSAEITVRVTDGDNGQTSDTFTLTVTPVNDDPKPGNDAFSVAENATYTADVLANDDVDTNSGNGGDTLTLLSIAKPQYGTATIKDNKLLYVPNAERDTSVSYQDVFTYTMQDSLGKTCTPTVTVTVTPVNDPPTISGISNVTGILEDATDGTGEIDFNVTDEEDDDNTLFVSAESDNLALFPIGNISIDNPTDDSTGTLRTVKVVPAADQFGSGKITLTVRDAQGLTATTSFTVTVDSVNDEPDNGDKSFTVVEDEEEQLDVLADIDPDYATTPGDYTITAIAQNPSHGTVRIADDKKSVYYTTAQDSNAPDSFRYTVYDAYGKLSYTFTAQITVTPVNDAPHIVYRGQAQYTINERTQQNDIPFEVHDVDNVAYSGGTDPVEVELRAASSNSILLVNGINIDTLTGYDRNIDVKPYLKWNGTTTVTITATDPDGLEATASFVLVVNNVNDAPVAVDDTDTILEDVTTTIDVLENDTDDDLKTNPDTEKLTVKTVTSSDPNATISAASDGSGVVVVPKANYNGPLSFTYTAVDSAGAVSNTATVNLTVQQVNDAPVPDNDSATTNEDTAVIIDVLDGDTDIDKESGLNAHPEDESLSIVLTGGGLTTPAHGTISTNGSTITYTPTKDYNGPDTFEYYCSDGDTKVKASVSVLVYQVNDAPKAVADTTRTNEDTPKLSIDVLANDTDVDTGTALNKNQLHSRSDFTITQATMTHTERGTIEIISNKLKFTPAQDWFGTEVVNYTMSDGKGGTASSTLTITVDSVNDLPVYTTVPVNLELTEDGADGTMDILVDDVETLKDDLSVTVTNSTNPTLIDITDVTVTAGTNGTRTITVNPKLDQNGTAKITLLLKDADGGEVSKEFTVTVASVNDAPIAADKTLNISEDAALQTIDKALLVSDVDTETNADELTLTITTAAAHGTAAVDTDGNVTYIPTANFNGVDTFVYTVTDKDGLSDTGTFTVNIAQVNDAPLADNDSATTDEDTTVIIDVLDGDSDIDMDEALNAHPKDESISVSLTGGDLTAPSHGTISTDGLTITYTPDANYNGTDTFEYYCSDGDVKTKALVTVTVNSVNDAPIAADKTLNITEDVALQTIDKVLLVSDVDTETNADELTLTITTAAGHGTAAVDTDGNVTYIPTADFNGVDTFVYTVTDKDGLSDTGTFTVNIAQVNDAPVPDNDSATTDEDTAVIIDVLDDDSDIDMDEALNAHPKDESISVSLTGGDLAAPSHGTISTDGLTITYTPDADYNGSDTFEYYCSDGDELVKASVSVAIKQVNDAPVANPDAATIDEDQETDYIHVLDNDTDVDIDPTLNQDEALLRSKFNISAASLSDSSVGTIDWTADSIQFTPKANWFGDATIYYTLQDGYGSSCSTALIVTVKPINDVPVFSTEPADMNLTEDGADGTMDILVDDVETTKDSLSVTVTNSTNPSLIDITDVTVTAGTNGTRTITVNPKDNQNGEATITLQVDDLTDGTQTVTFVVTVASVNDAPIAADKTLNISEDAALQTIDQALLVDDVDIETNADELTLTITTAAAHGTAAVDTDGNVTYVPTANFNGVDTFVYTVTDKDGLSDTGTFTVNIAQVNDAPVPDNDSATTDEDTAVVIDVLDGDSDIDMDEALNEYPKDESISVSLTGGDLTAPSHGTISTDGLTITYTPDADYNGTDTFEYYCSDGDELVKASVSVAIKQVNDNPVATSDTANTDEDNATTPINVLSNDTDIDIGSTLNQGVAHERSTFTVTDATVTDSAHGSVKIVDNKLIFTPADNWFGEEVIQYTMSDGNHGTASSTVTVTVNSVNDLPYLTVAPADQTITEDGEDGVSLFNVNDVETKPEIVNVTLKSCDNTTLIPLSAIKLEHKGGGGWTITVNPADNLFGDALITLVLEDEDGGKTEVTMEVHVASVNDAPTAADKTLNISEDAALQTIDKALLVSDVDTETNADELTLTITTAAGHGTAAVDTDGNVTYTPTADFNGVDTFVYTVTDKDGATDTGTFTVNIAQVNDAPLADNDSATTDEDTAVIIDVLDGDSDIDMDEALNARPKDESISVSLTGGDLTAPSHGTISTDGLTITYTPDANYNGSDTFEYYCSDGDELVKASVSVAIKQVNDAPLANADSTATDEDTPVRYNVLANDDDVDTYAALNEDALHSKSDFVIDDCYFYGETNGTLESDGTSILYTPADNFHGTQVIRYVLSDGNGKTSIGTLTILVDSENDTPVAKPDSMSAEEDNVASVNVLTNDTDNDTDDTKTFVDFLEPTSGLPGTFTTTESGDITFTPDANYNGTFDITYQMRDAAGATSSATLTVTITPVNDAPVADDSLVSTDEDTTKQIDVASLISDVDIDTNADTIQVSVAAAGEPAHGSVSVSGTKITYTPDANYNGADEIIYTLTDSKGVTDTGKLSLTIVAVNDAPVAADDTKLMDEDTTPSIFVLMNDSDIDTDLLLNLTPSAAPYILSVTDGAHGTATIDGDKIVYTPTANYNGTDEISYVLSDGLLTAGAKVSITIMQVNDGIHAGDDTAKTNDEETVTVDVLANDSDVDTDSALNAYERHPRSDFDITEVGTPAHGVAKLLSGKIEYTPEDRFAGADSFTYTVTDGHGTTATATVRITVISVNDPPVILAVSSPKDGERAGTGSKVVVNWTSFDIDGDALTYTLEYFDGKFWNKIADDLTDTTFTFAIPDSLASTDGLKFRVNARDSEFTSDYGYSGAMKVDKDAPKGTVVTMQTADGRAYTAGTWTNQTVTVVASSAVDASNVTYYYDMDGGTSAAGTGMDVVAGVHTLNIKAVDEYSNTTVVGGYLARVDKQQPATPEIRQSVSGGSILLTLTLQTDPGGSGNDKLTLPDGTTVKATGSPTFATTKNGTYSFTLTDVAGNRRTFTYTVSTVDQSKPAITLSSGTYHTGTTTLEPISATLTFTDAESDITTRGYQLSQSSTPSGTYRTYDGALKMSDPGTYYIHAMAKNAFGLATYETFGPFVIEAAQEPGTSTSPTPVPTSGDVVVTKEDLEEIPGDTVKIRLPGKEWNETLTLEDVGPGTYLIEAIDADGNIRTVEVRVTMRDIFARSIRSAGDSVTAAAIGTISALAAVFFLLLLAGHNITVVVVGARGGAQQKVRTLRRIQFRKKELIVKLSDKHLAGGESCNIKIAKSLSKEMRKNTVIVTMRGEEVLRELIPEDFNEAFTRTILIEK